MCSMKFAFPAVFASVAAITSYKRVSESGLYYGGIGPVEGWSYPQMGGQNGDQVTMGGYSPNTYFLSVFNPDGTGLISGLNASTETAVGSLLGFGDFSVSKGSPLPVGKPVTAFVSSVSGYDGVFVQLPDGGIQTIASTLELQPLANNQSFNLLRQVSVEVSEDLTTIFVAFCAYAGAYSGGWRGVLLASLPVTGGDVSLTLIADNTYTIPGSEAVFKCLGSPAVTRKGDVTFFGSYCGSSGVSQMVSDQFNNLMMYKSEPVVAHALTRHRTLGASATDSGLYRSVDGVISVIANDKSTVPGSENEFFAAFSDPGVGLDGTIAFVSLCNNGTYGIWKYTDELKLVTSNHFNVPGYSGCPFRNFPQAPSVDGNGNAVFFGQCDEKVGGVFAEQSDGSLGTVITYDDKVDGYETIYLGFGTNAASGNKAALYMVLDDTNVTNGVWAFDVPTSEDALL